MNGNGRRSCPEQAGGGRDDRSRACGEAAEPGVSLERAILRRKEAPRSGRDIF
jgi:hypothetical protein